MESTADRLASPPEKRQAHADRIALLDRTAELLDAKATDADLAVELYAWALMTDRMPDQSSFAELICGRRLPISPPKE